jgi:hypothetical protein
MSDFFADENVIFCVPSVLQLELYHRAVLTKLNDSFQSAAAALLLVNYLRMLCSHPCLVCYNNKSAAVKIKIKEKKIKARLRLKETSKLKKEKIIEKRQKRIQRLRQLGVKIEKNVDDSDYDCLNGEDNSGEKGSDIDLSENDETNSERENNTDIDDEELSNPIVSLFNSTTDETERHQILSILDIEENRQHIGKLWGDKKLSENFLSSLHCSSKLCVLDALLLNIKEQFPREKVVISSVYTKVFILFCLIYGEYIL